MTFLSTGRPLEIGIVTDILPHLINAGFTVRTVDRGSGPTLCSTPCTLYFPAARIPMWAGHEGFFYYNFAISGTHHDHTVRLRAGRVSGRDGTDYMILGGLLLSVAGGVLVATDPSNATVFWSGMATLGGGASLFAGVIMIFVFTRPGVRSTEPFPFTVAAAPAHDPSPPRLAASDAPAFAFSLATPVIRF